MKTEAVVEVVMEVVKMQIEAVAEEAEDVMVEKEIEVKDVAEEEEEVV